MIIARDCTDINKPWYYLQHNFNNMNIFDRFLSVIAPYNCIGCNIEGSILCMECSEQIDRLPSICYSCGKATGNYKLCGDCIGKNKPTHVWIVANYNNLAKDIVAACKFESKRSAASEMAKMIDSTLPYFPQEPLVVFVPTANNHVRERGLDHSKLIAIYFAKLRGWRYLRLLIRTTGARQLGATRDLRKKQLDGAFRINSGLAKCCKNRYILLIDDVITTGATIEECTKQLYKAGAKQVDVAVFARTPNKVGKT